jgi:hypothetical protein
MGYGRQTEGQSVDFVSLPALTSFLVHPALDIASDPDQGIQVEVRMGSPVARNGSGESTEEEVFK